MTDPEKLEKITDGFVKLVVGNAFQHPKFYADLALRLATIVNYEIEMNLNHEKLRDELMKFWPEGSLN